MAAAPGPIPAPSAVPVAAAESDTGRADLKVLVLGATGATGRCAITQLIEKKIRVRTIVRSRARLLEVVGPDIGSSDLLEITEAVLSDLSQAQITEHVDGCTSVMSFLGHNMTCSGLFGSPRRLVLDACRRVCIAIVQLQPAKPIRFLLMNTVGVSHPDGSENWSRSCGESCVLSCLLCCLPPHADNVYAADHLYNEIGEENKFIEWSVVRPDTLLDTDVCEYKVESTLRKNQLFDNEETSRANVAAFMIELAQDPAVWQQWRFQFPKVTNVVKDDTK
jgi:nucleoside-diphosphate-sugar epimerase